VTPGKSIPSPAWTSSIARTISGPRRVLQEKARGAGAQRAQHQLVGVERGEHDDGRRRELAAQQPRRRDPVDERHADVHQHDVRPMHVDGGRHVAPVTRLAHDRQPLRAREHHLQPAPHERVVVDQQNPDHAGTAAPAGRPGRPARTRP
jgi:hypothetical protein